MFGRCFFLANATVHRTVVVRAAAIKISAALLNSGTVGVEAGLAVAEAPVLGEAAEVGLGVAVGVPLDGSDITARLPMKPSVEPGLLIA